jgi:hypothetical protein
MMTVHHFAPSPESLSMFIPKIKVTKLRGDENKGQLHKPFDALMLLNAELRLFRRCYASCVVENLPERLALHLEFLEDEFEVFENRSIWRAVEKDFHTIVHAADLRYLCLIFGSQVHAKTRHGWARVKMAYGF